jgi:RNase P subunit RPR2
MKSKLTRKEAQEKIDSFFTQKKELNPLYVKKIKRLAMKYNIKLGVHRRRFCKKCYSDLKKGKIRITKTHKIIECPNCKERNRFRAGG